MKLRGTLGQTRTKIKNIKVVFLKFFFGFLCASSQERKTPSIFLKN